MFDLNLLEDNSIIITPNSIKKTIINFTNSTNFNLKYLTKEELIKNFIFNYDDRAIAYLMTKGYSFSNAKEILENLYFVKKGNDKLNKLFAIKEELIQKDLLINNYLFKQLFFNKKVYVYGYSPYDKELKMILNQLDIQFFYLQDQMVNGEIEVYEYNEIDDEVDNAFNMICHLINQGIDINKIKLFSYGDDYDLIVKKYAIFYHLPINFKKEMRLYESPYFNMFLEEYSKSDLINAFSNIQSRVEIDNYDFLNHLKQLLFDIYGIFENKELEKQYLIDKSKHIYLSNINSQGGIEIVDENYLLDDYIFILGFNLSNFPKVYKDVNYLSNEEKQYLGINTSVDMNLIEEERLVNFLKIHSHLHLFYKCCKGKEIYYPSVLIEKLNMKVIKGYITNIQFSLPSAIYKVCSYKDNENNYGLINSYVNALLDDILDYKTYNHKYNGFLKFDGQPLFLSYTSIENYYNCPFSYYVSRILNLNEFEEKFNTKLGSYFHDILESCSYDGIDVNKCDNEIDKIFETSKEKYFAKKLIRQIKNVIDYNYQFIQENNLNFECEKELKIQLNNENYLKGKIDKIIYDSQKNKAIIIDYKTYNFEFDQRKVNYGLSMQLPLYSFLMNKVMPNIIQEGVYIQNVLNDTTYSLKDLRLKGISKFDSNLVKCFDSIMSLPSQKSSYIAGWTTTKEGLKKTNSMLDEQEWNELISLTAKKIEEAFVRIRQGEFSISPVKFKDSNACQYCNHRSICFMDIRDYRYINLEDGDSNEQKD